MKFDISEFYEKLSEHFSLNLNQTSLMTISYADVIAFMEASR
jgi:hypothetical protein